MEFLSKKQKIFLGVLAIIMLIFIGYHIIKKTENYSYEELEIIEENTVIENNEEINEEETTEEIIVHVTGEVKNEGIIKIKKYARIADQTTPNMIQRIIGIFERKPLISKEI